MSRNVMIPQETVLEIATFLEKIDFSPEDPPDWDLLQKILPVVEEKLERMCLRADYSKSLSAGLTQRRNGAVKGMVDNENL